MRRSISRPNPTLLKQKIEEYLTDIKQLRVQLETMRSAVTQANKKETTSKNLPVKAAGSRILKARMKKRASNVKIRPVSFIPKTAELVRSKNRDIKNHEVTPLTNNTATTKNGEKPDNVENNSSKPNTNKKENQTEISNGKLDTIKNEDKKEINEKNDTNRKADQEKTNDNLGITKKDQQEINNPKFGIIKIVDQVDANNKELDTKDQKGINEKLNTIKKEDQPEINNCKLDTSTTKDDPGAAVIREERRVRIRFGRGKGSLKRHQARSH